MPTEVNCSSIPEALFRDNSIVAVEFNCWSGTATVKEGDEDIFGARNFDKNFFKRGSVILCDKERLKAFQNRQERLSSYLDGIGGERFPIISGRVFKNKLLPQVIEAIHECMADIDALRSIFRDTFPAERDRRIREFDERHPDHRGRLSAYYDSLGDVTNKFGVQYAMFKIADLDAHNRILEDEKNALRIHCRNFLEQAAANFRKSVVDAALAFRRGIEKASGPDGSGVVHSRSVSAFKNFLERVENHDLLDDKQMRDMLNGMKTQVFNIQSWDVKGDAEAMDEIKRHLDSIVSVGEAEGEASVIAQNYSIGMSDGEAVEIESEAAVSATLLATEDDDVEIES